MRGIGLGLEFQGTLVTRNVYIIFFIDIFLSKAKSDTINLKNNYYLFSILIINKDILRLKNNYNASNKIIRRDKNFIKNIIIIIENR